MNGHWAKYEPISAPWGLQQQRHHLGLQLGLEQHHLCWHQSPCLVVCHPGHLPSAQPWAALPLAAPEHDTDLSRNPLWWLSAYVRLAAVNQTEQYAIPSTQHAKSTEH